jgi:hypothetical protein
MIDEFTILLYFISSIDELPSNKKPMKSPMSSAPAIPTALRGQGGQVAVASGWQTRGHPWADHEIHGDFLREFMVISSCFNMV